MADVDDLTNIVRKGIVQSVDREKLKARVKFGDKGGIISGELYITARPVNVVPEKGVKSGDKTSEEEGHSHKAYVTDWVPKIGDMVICLMIPDADGEGYILGGVR